MIYLGIDPGTKRTGWGVIEDTGDTLRALGWGILGTSGTDSSGDKVEARRALAALLKKWRPDAAAIERLFFVNNKRSVMAVSEMRGVLMLTLQEHALVVHEFSPPQVKQAVCGYGRAQKPQVQQMTRTVLGIREVIEPDDAADALALAVCCATAQKRY